MTSLREFVYFNNRSDTERRILEAACSEYGVAPEMVDELIRIEINQEGRMRRVGIFNDLRKVIENYVQEHQDDYS